MKKLMMTTAIVAMTSMGAIAQTADTTTAGSDAAAMNQNVPAFVASDFTSKTLYTLDSEEARALHDAGGERARWESSPTFAADRDAWESIGGISDLVITKDGDVRGILIDVGGFLGFGARTVMIDIDELYFVADDSNPDALDDFLVVASLSKEQLEALPEWDSEQLSIGYEATHIAPSSTVAADTGTATGTDTTDQAAMSDAETDPMQSAASDLPDGYSVMDAEERTADRLMGAEAYSSEGESIATVSDLVLNDDGGASHVIMDVGGFLGMGSHTVAIDVEQVNILWNDADGDVVVQVPMTEDQLRDMPEYQG
jgi:sporulation protein YlmC with PRC-barrel domain